MINSNEINKKKVAVVKLQKKVEAPCGNLINYIIYFFFSNTNFIDLLYFLALKIKLKSFFSFELFFFSTTNFIDLLYFLALKIKLKSFF